LAPKLGFQFVNVPQGLFFQFDWLAVQCFHSSEKKLLCYYLDPSQSELFLTVVRIHFEGHFTKLHCKLNNYRYFMTQWTLFLNLELDNNLPQEHKSLLVT